MPLSVIKVLNVISFGLNIILNAIKVLNVIQSRGTYYGTN